MNSPNNGTASVAGSTSPGSGSGSGSGQGQSQLTQSNNNFLRPSPPELYKDCRLGKFDLVVWGRPNGDVKIGRIEKLSKVTKKRTDDGMNCDQSGDPHFYYVYPKFHPDESIFKIRPIELKISDRYLKVGFVVKEFETRRVGYVQGIKQQITVKLLEYDLIIRDIEFRDLIDPWKLNIQHKRPVFCNGWIGRISCPVQRRVWLRFIDKRVRAFSFSIPWNELAHILIECGIVKMTTFSFESSGFAFWPGKKYKIPKSIILNSKYNTEWEGGVRPQVQETDGPIIIRIVKTEVMPFRIQWSKRIPGFDTDRPKDTFKEEEVKNIRFIRPVQTACLGDVRMYRIKSDDFQNLITEENWKMVLRRRYWLPRAPGISMKNKMEEQEMNKSLSPLEQNEEHAVEIIYTRSTAEVAWADGKISRIDSSKVCRVRSEFFDVGTFVEPITLPGINTFGVIQQIKIIDKVSLVKDISSVVKWFYFGNDEDPDDQTYETELPLKLLRSHSKFNFKSSSCMNVIVSRAHPDQELTVGYVVNTYPDGKVRVRCVDGCVRRYWPFEINRIYLDSNEMYPACKSRDDAESTRTVGNESPNNTTNLLPLSLSSSSSKSANSNSAGRSTRSSPSAVSVTAALLSSCGRGCAGAGKKHSDFLKENFIKNSNSKSSIVSSNSNSDSSKSAKKLCGEMNFRSSSSNVFTNSPSDYEHSQALNSSTWRKAIKQASVKNISWKEQMAFRESQDKAANAFRLHASKSTASSAFAKFNTHHKIKN